MDTLKAAGSPAATAGGPLTVAKIGSWAVNGATARTNAPSRSRPVARGRGDRSSPLAGQVDADGDRGAVVDGPTDRRDLVRVRDFHLHRLEGIPFVLDVERVIQEAAVEVRGRGIEADGEATDARDVRVHGDVARVARVGRRCRDDAEARVVDEGVRWAHDDDLDGHGGRPAPEIQGEGARREGELPVGRRPVEAEGVRDVPRVAYEDRID